MRVEREIICKTVLLWVGVNIIYQVSEIIIMAYLFSPEWLFKQRSVSSVNFVDTLGVTAEKTGKLPADYFIYIVKSLVYAELMIDHEFSQCLLASNPDQ